MFQSTHPQRVRLKVRLTKKRHIISFNPRTHKGCDIERQSEPKERKRFNPRTHKGCDLCFEHHNQWENGFQSTHPQRVRQKLNAGLQATFLFQSTHPQRVRPTVLFKLMYPPFGFNPRTHKGCDLGMFNDYNIQPCFNPRTHKGCD